MMFSRRASQAVCNVSTLLVCLALLAGLCAGCAANEKTALVLDIFDLIDRFFIEKVDRRELVTHALSGLVDRLKLDVQFDVQSEKIKEFLKARENGEESPTPEMEESPTPIPTPYDHVKVESTIDSVTITVDDAVFNRPLPAEKRQLAQVLFDGIAFLKQTLMLEQSEDELLQTALDAMVQHLDPHSGFLNLKDYQNLREDTEGSFGGVGIEIGIRDGFLTVISPIEDTPADKAGIQSQDRIVGIDGVSSLGQTLTWAVQRLRGKIGAPVVMTIKRPGVDDPFDVEVVRAKIEAVALKSKMLPGGIAHLHVTQFNARTSADLDEALKKLDVGNGKVRLVVLDLRNNPGGLFDQTIAVTEKFLRSGLIVNTIGRGYTEDHERFASGNGRYTEIPMVVLINSGSASASEIVAGALKDHNRALVVGFQTFGKGSVQTIFPLRNETGLRLTTAMYYTPSGESIQAYGITPHVRFNLPAVEKERRDAFWADHDRRQKFGEHPTPQISIDVEPIYDYYLKRGWISEDINDDDSDFALAFVQRLLQTNDFSIKNLIARAEAMFARIPQPPKPKPEPESETAAEAEPTEQED